MARRILVLLVLAVVPGVALPRASSGGDLIPAGSINAAFSRRPVTLVVENEPRIQAYARAIASRFFPDAEVLEDAAALEADLAGRTLVVYGTPAGNAWLRRHRDQLPFRYDNDGVWLERKFTGKSLRVISTIRNPSDRDQRAILYTARKPEDVVGINSVFHGPTEWVVADGNRVLASGNYERRGKLTPAAMRRDLDFLVEKIEKDHPATVDGIPQALEAVIRNARERVEKPLAPNDFWFVLERVILGLRDAHSSLDPLQSGASIDLPFRWLEGGMVVTEDTEHLRPGDRILEVGKCSEEELLDLLRGLVPAENDRWIERQGETALRDVAVLQALGIAKGAPVEVVVERNGARKTLSLPISPKRRPRTGDVPWVRWKVDAASSLGVLTVDQCRNDETYRRTLREFFQAVQDTGIERIAVDVRENGGGSSRVIDEFLSYVDVADYYKYTGDVRESADSRAQRRSAREIGYYRYGRTRVQNPRKTEVRPFGGKVYVLTSNRTFSSGNWFAVVAQDNGIGEVLGEATGNAPSSYGDVLNFTLPESGVSFHLSHKKWVRPDPSRDPADSLVPDRHIPLEREHLIEGVDPVLEYLSSTKK